MKAHEYWQSYSENWEIDFMYFNFIQWLCKNTMVDLILVRDEKFEVNPTKSNRDEPHLIPRIYWDYSYNNILFYFEK